MVVSFLRKKPLGMQTLFDQVFILFIQNNWLAFCNFAFEIALFWFIHKTKFVHPCIGPLAEFFTFLSCFLMNSFALSGIWVVLVRFGSIAMPGLLDDYADDKIVKIAKLTSFAWAFLSTGFDLMFITDMNNIKVFKTLMGDPLETFGVARSIVLNVGTMIVCFTFLQIYIEVETLKLQKCINMKNYLTKGSTEDHNINFFRVTVMCVIGTFVILKFVKAPYYREDFIPMSAILQFLANNAFFFAIELNKGHKMRKHVKSWMKQTFSCH